MRGCGTHLRGCGAHLRGCGAHLRGHWGGLTGAGLWARRADISRRYELARSTEGAQVSKEETGRLVVCGVWGVAPVGAAFSLRGTTHSLVVPRHPTHTPLVDGSRLWNGRSVYVKLSVNHSLQWRIAAGLRCAICWAPRGGGGCSGAAGSSPGGPRPEGGVYIYRRMNSSSICEDWRGPQRPN